MVKIHYPLVKLSSKERCTAVLPNQLQAMEWFKLGSIFMDWFKRGQSGAGVGDHCFTIFLSSKKNI